MPDIYGLLKWIHTVCALLSISGFVFRASLRLRDSAWLSHKMFRILPHINDTVLLLCGVTMALLSGFNPLQQGWLAGKLLLLLAYILCGFYVLKWGKTRQQQLVGTVLALGCFTAIAVLALLKPL